MEYWGLKMILESLILKNIRSYNHEKIEFPKGITLFEGDIGSGKSTVLMAIEFALFGLGSQKAESLLAKKSEDGYVQLEFSVDGQKYEIKRTLKRKSNGVNQDPKNSWIKSDGVVEPLSPSELKQRVLQILKFNEPADPKAESRIFRYAIFTPQETMKEVLSEPTKRMSTIRKAFGIEDYSIAEANAKELLSELQTRAAVLQEKFGNIAELELLVKESEETKKKLDLDIAITAKKKTDLEKLEADKELALKELQNKNRQRITIMSKKERLEEKIEYSRKKIEEIEKEFLESEEELRENSEKLEKLVEIRKPETLKTVNEITLEIRQLQKINDELIRYDSEKNTTKEDLTRLKVKFGERGDKKDAILETLQNLKNERESLEKFSDELKEKLEEVKSSKVSKQTTIDSLKKEIAEFEDLGNLCPTCKQEIASEYHHKLIDSKNKESQKINLELKNVTDSFFEINSKLKEIQTRLDSYDAEILEISKIIPGIEEHDAKLAKLEKIEAKIIQLTRESGGKEEIERLNQVKDQIIQFEGAIKQIEQIISIKQKIENEISKNQNEVGRLEYDISQSESELEEIEKELESLENLDELIKTESEFALLRKEITNISSSFAALVERQKNESEKREQYKSKIEESIKWKSKFEIVTQYKDWLKMFFIPTISQIEKQVLLSILQNFNETYGRWYSILVEDYTKESRIDENFTPIISQDGFEQDISFLSGGEKTSIALAYRLTLNSLMRKEIDSMKSNLLILDEPTDGFSKTQLSKVQTILQEINSEQIILVSHEKELETYVNFIFRVTKEDGLSRIAKLDV